MSDKPGLLTDAKIDEWKAFMLAGNAPSIWMISRLCAQAKLANSALPAGSVVVPREPSECPVCHFKTKINGRLQHARDCNMKSREKSLVTDSMRHAAWTIYPNADVPYTEIFEAMLSAAPRKEE